MLDTISLMHLAIIRYNELLRSAELYRLVRSLNIQQPGFLARIRSSFGTTLIVIGRKLQGREASQTAAEVHLRQRRL